MNKFQDWWYGTWMYSFYYKSNYWYTYHLSGIPGRLKKIVKYISILWYDKDWDMSYTYALLGRKLRDLRASIQSGNILKHENRYVKQITICIELIDRITEDSLRGSYFDTLNSASFPEYTDREWEVINCTLKDSRTRTQKARNIYITKREMDKDRYNYELLYKYMSKYSRHWWW